MSLNREHIFELYMKKVNKIANNCEDKTCFTAEECVDMVIDCIEELESGEKGCTN